jgi:transcriptional regulator with XRE-family HTH domain
VNNKKQRRKIMRTLGDSIKEAVAAKGLTQEQVARQVGIDRTMISKYMNNHVDVPKDIKRKLVKYLSDPVLRIKFYGTTSSNIVFDKTHLKFYNTAVKAIE